jgi:hypothetical protein
VCPRALFWFFAHCLARGFRKNDIYSGSWVHTPTLEDGRQQARKQETFWRKALPVAMAALVISLPLLIVGGMSHRR